MTTLLEFREKLKIFLGKYDVYLFPVLKFLLALVSFLLINGNIGFMEKLKNPAIAIVMALVCSFLPVNVMVVLGAGLILAHAYALSMEVLVVAFVMFALMFLLYFRVASRYAWLLVLTPLAFVLKIPYLVPLAVGLVATPAAAVPVAFGTFVYYLLHYMKLNTTILSGTESASMQQKLTYLVDNVINNKEMFLVAAAFVLTVIVVYVIRRMSVDYAWTIAIGAGAVVDLAVILIGSLILSVSVKLLPLLLGSILSAVLALALQATIFSVDYSRTEYVQFEDDEYYYYVKAVPKLTIAVPEKTVKKISTRRKPAAKKPAGGKKPAAVRKSTAGKKPAAQRPKE